MRTISAAQRTRNTLLAETLWAVSSAIDASTLTLAALGPLGKTPSKGPFVLIQVDAHTHAVKPLSGSFETEEEARADAVALTHAAHLKGLSAFFQARPAEQIAALSADMPSVYGDDFLTEYVHAALSSSRDREGKPMSYVEVGHLSSDDLQRMLRDCEKFEEGAVDLLNAYDVPDSEAALAFWRARNGDAKAFHEMPSMRRHLHVESDNHQADDAARALAKLARSFGPQRVVIDLDGFPGVAS